MSRWLRYLAGLALALPMGAYVAGSLIASANDEPGPRTPVHLEQRPAGGSDRDTPDPVPTAESAGPEKARGEDAGDDGENEREDDQEDDGDDGSPTDDDASAVDDNGIRVVKPEPSRLDKADDEDDDAGDDAGDDSRDGDDAGGDDSGNSGASRDD